MKKAFLSFLFIQMMFMPLAPQAFSQCGTCGTLANDLSLVLPCVEYEGAYYKLNFSAYTNPADPAWFYWQFQSIQPVTGGSNCAHLDNNFTITAPCVYFAGKNLAITLEYSEWPYWKLGSQFTINPVEIRSISGDTTYFLTQNYNTPDFYAALNDYFACIMQCGEDVTCIMACMPDLGLGSAFSLVFELCNPGTTDIYFILPAGAFFQAGASDVQPMLIATDICLIAEPGCIKFLVPTYCMDGYAHAPSPEDTFAISGIAQQACIAEILDLIRGKEEISHADSYIIQEAVWTCMEFGSITEDQRTDLQNL